MYNNRKSKILITLKHNNKSRHKIRKRINNRR